MTRLLITGSRYGHPLVERWLDAWAERHGAPELVVLGDAAGVDEQARRHCALHGLPYERVPVDPRIPWPAKGPERNGRMVAMLRPGDAALAFPGPESRGTWDCARKAEAAGARVFVAEPGAR